MKRLRTEATLVGEAIDKATDFASRTTRIDTSVQSLLVVTALLAAVTGGSMILSPAAETSYSQGSVWRCWPNATTGPFSLHRTGAG
jgi:hypothetical protein